MNKNENKNDNRNRKTPAEMETDAVEVCPFCGAENVYRGWKTEDGYKARCHSCGAEIMLCDECCHADDNPGHKCNWRENDYYHTDTDISEVGMCFRGIRRRNDSGK